MLLTKIHPITGEVLEPIYRTKRGALVWPQMGAAPDDPDAGDGTGEEDDDDVDGDGTGGSGGDDDASKDKDDKVSRDELDAIIRRMKAADQRASKAEARLKQIDDGNKDELTKATERLAELEDQNKKLQERIREGDLRDAFGQVEGVAWRKPATALRIARADGYLDEVLDDDGNVDSKKLAKKVKEFAEAYPELLKGDGSSGSNGSGGTPPQSGQPTGSGRKKPGQVDDKDITKRYGHLLR